MYYVYFMSKGLLVYKGEGLLALPVDDSLCSTEKYSINLPKKDSCAQCRRTPEFNAERLI